jgi:hypothetical protein
VPHGEAHLGAHSLGGTRSYQHEAVVFDPLHYLALLEQKTRALDQAAPLVGWQLPDGFLTLRRLLEAKLGMPGNREYIQVLRLLETFALEQVTGAVEDALRLGTISFDAVKHLLLCRIERRSPRLDMENWPHLPLARVRSMDLSIMIALDVAFCSKLAFSMSESLMDTSTRRAASLYSADNSAFSSWTACCISGRARVFFTA